MKKTALIFALLALAAPVAAQDLIVKFAGSTPSDQISFEANGCDLSNTIVMLDLAGSAGDLIFDASKGTSAHQPVEITSGYGALSPVRDGDKRLQVLVRDLPRGEFLNLSAQLSDTHGQGAGMTFTPSHIAGASIRVALSDRVLKGTFDAAGTAKVTLPADASVCMASAN